MGKSVLHYDRMVENALRGVLREALTLSLNGLPGEHHFYITFRTGFPGVDIADSIRARYPDEMTIVLQHQFWGLEVTQDWFEVTLSFNRINERLHIPFAAVTAFADPSAKFGLQFQVDVPDDATVVPAAVAPLNPIPAPTPAAVAPLPLERRDSTAKDPSADKDATPESPKERADSSQGAQVIALDAFRKK